jgi:hypothetical protein
MSVIQIVKLHISSSVRGGVEKESESMEEKVAIRSARRAMIPSCTFKQRRRVILVVYANSKDHNFSVF